MFTKINQEELDLIKAIQVIKKYHEKEAVGIKDFNEDVWRLIDLLINTAMKQHSCPNCGAKLKLYILTNL